MTKNIISQVYGRLTVIGEPFRKEYGTQGKRRSYVECRCSCGTVGIYQVTCLKSGHTQSCGCLHREQLSNRRTTHGHRINGRNSSTYSSYRAMITRCTNPNCFGYSDYGGRGIKVCDRWLGDQGFQNFLEDRGPRPEGMTLDRYPDKDGDYTPENCRWATDKEQANNKRNNRLITAFGSTQTLAQWAEETGISYSALKSRIRKGWAPEDAVMEPVR